MRKLITRTIKVNGIPTKVQMEIDTEEDRSVQAAITTDKILQKLAQANLIRTTESQPETYLPATPATNLKAEEISARLWGAESSQTPTLGRELADTFFKAGNKALPENPWENK